MKTIQKVVYKCEICGKEFERISEAVADEANCKMKQQEENKTKTETMKSLAYLISEIFNDAEVLIEDLDKGGIVVVRHMP